MSTTHSAAAPAEEEQRRGFSHQVLGWRLLSESAAFGSLPVLGALAAIAIIFQSLNGRFLSAINLSNLIAQVTSTGLIALGIYVVLLLGEIDLSVGSVSGLTAAVFAVLTVKSHDAPIVAFLAALGVGLAIGLLQGLLFTYFGVPSFVVTLAGLIGWQGLQLQVLGSTGDLNLPNSFVTGLTTVYFSRRYGWILAAVAVAAVVASRVYDDRARRRDALPALRRGGALVGALPAAALVVGAVAVLNSYRGVPLAGAVFVGLVVVFALVTRHTRLGRYVLAVGGNAEAARRAGVKVARIRIIGFGVSGLMAAAGGVFAASRLIEVNQSSGSGDVLLNAIAAVVIGGTSLFGGRGTAWSALLGVLVIGAISNGMDLIGLSSATKFMITGVVLLFAVIVDATSRRARSATGL